MADTTTTNILLTNQEAGGNNNTWGDIADANFEQIDDVLGDTLALSGLTGGTTVLTDEQQFVAIINCTGTLVSNQNVEFTTGRGGFWIVANNTTGAFTLTCRVTGQTGVQIDQGRTQLIYSDASDILFGNPDISAVAEEAVASSGTTDVLGTSSEFVEVTGTTTITSLGTGVNRKRFVRFSGALTLTHNATTLILPTGANITTAADDTMILVSDASSNVRVYAYQKADGSPLTLGAGSIPGDATLSGDLTLSGANTHSGINSFTNTSHTAIAGGTTAQRPGAPAEGQERKNTTFSIKEYYDGTTWMNMGTVPSPQGYLTTVSGTPVITSDQSGVGTVYYAFDKGAYVPISDGSGWSALPLSSELSLTLNNPGQVADTLYDLYLWNDAGTIRLVSGIAWTTSTAGAGARGTGGGTAELTRLLGIRTNANSMTVRYGATTDTMGANEGLWVGTLLIDGTAGQTTQHVSYGQSRRWGLWNAYNQRQLLLKAGTSTASWQDVAATTWEAADQDTGNAVRVLAGFPDGPVKLTARQKVTAGTGELVAIGVGEDSTSAFSGHMGQGFVDSNFNTGAAGPHNLTARHSKRNLLGLSVFTHLNYNKNVNSGKFFGAEDHMILEAEWMG
jgi:hypothetical protein